MRIHRSLSWIAVGLASVAAWATSTDPEADLLRRAQEMFKPLPADFSEPGRPLSPERIALGRTLFFDPRISLDGTSSCARCHQPALHGTDGLARSVGVKDRLSRRNAPTVLNAALQVAQHWNGDRTGLEDQAMKALLGPASYGHEDYAAAMGRIQAIPEYRALFAKAFPGTSEPLTPENWASAISDYERTLVSESPFDAFLRGNAGALSVQQRSGLTKFINVGCAGCHGGVGIGGSSYRKFGVVEDYWKATGSKTIDKGRIEVTKEPVDECVFKVPTLRNVSRTAPYFHDGSVASLEQAVKIMAKVQLGRDLGPQDIADIVAFLDSLTGTIPPSFATAPILPPGGFSLK